MVRDVECRLCDSPSDPAWVLSFQDGGQQPTEGAREALLALGNGYVASRGAVPEACADAVHYPGTYVAGFYDRLTSQVGGRPREDESLVNLPNWLSLTFRPSGGTWFAPDTAALLHEHVALDLRRGLLTREAVVADHEDRRTRLRQRRLVSMAAPHVMALETSIAAQNWSGRLDVRSALDGRVSNGNSAAARGLAGQHLGTATTGTEGPETVWLVAETTGSGLRVAQAARTCVHGDGLSPGPVRRTVTEQNLIAQELGINVWQGEQVTLEKVVSIFTSRDPAIYEPLNAARRELADAGGFEQLLAAHSKAWEQLWRRFGIGLSDGEEATLAVNTNLFHLLQTLSPHAADLDVGVPARGLHGEGYLGHVFWDELFVFPFLNLRLPELTRALLRYRHRRLPEARRHAAAIGAKGALFPWQSGSDGREESPSETLNPYTERWRPDHSGRQYHVNLAVAYNVWRYWQTTADIGFLAAYGAELITETARLWASLATYDPSTDRYDIRDVIGPDEFHDGYPDHPGEGIDNSAYVNVMTAWALTRACDVHQILSHHDDDQLWHTLGLSEDELRTWEHIATRLRLSFLPGGVLEQFDGYRDLAELDWAGYRARYGDIRQLGHILDAENDSTNRYQVSKQADVLMLLYLFSAEELTGLIRRLGYDFDPATIPRTVEYYLDRTAHGSTLSRVAHAWVLARTNRRGSWNMLRQALDSDLADSQATTTREGIHLGAIGGALDILQRCYPGLDTLDERLWLDPMLPDELHRLDFDIRYRGQWINTSIEHHQITLHALPCAAVPITVAIHDTLHRLAPGDTITVPTKAHSHPA
jgi:trehalose/maltose hydrolase-like predicted phosphorylase